VGCYCNGCRSDALPNSGILNGFLIRAIHICQRDDPATGGAARVAVELVKRLPDHGVVAKCLFVYGAPGHFLKELEGRCTHLGLTSSRQALLHGRRLRSLLRAEMPDVIHHHDGLIWTHFISRRFPGLLRYGHAHLDPPSSGTSFRHRIANWVQRRTYHRLICVSTSTRESWIARGFPAHQATVLRNGVDTGIFRPATEVERVDARRSFHLPQDARVIAFVGRLHNAMKGPDDFLRVLALLPREFYGLVAGVGPDESSLKALAVELGIGNRVFFAGLLATTAKCYHAADVLLVTSHYEPFGLIVLEATACGIPVAGFSARGGLMQLLRQVDAVVVDQRNCRALAHAVLRLATSESGTRTLRRAYIEAEYSWDKAAELLAQSYSRALYHNR
jgi:glycosyltransferase involved in cell wall biosynthesis